MKMRWLLGTVLGALLALPVQAEEGEAEAGTRYLELTPAIVTNFGGPGRMRYIKAEVSLQVDSQAEFDAVFHHFPVLRHTMVMLLSRQMDPGIVRGEPKEQLRQQALAALREVMLAEEGEEMIDDLLFSSLFVQR